MQWDVPIISETRPLVRVEKVRTMAFRNALKIAIRLNIFLQVVSVVMVQQKMFAKDVAVSILLAAHQGSFK